MATKTLDLPDSRRIGIPVLVGSGDILAVFAFAITGLRSHGVEPWLVPWHTFVVAFPFVVGWLLVAPLGNLYAVDTIRSLRRTLPRIVVAWAGATVVGAMIRSTALFPGGTAPTFLFVTFGVGLALLLSWRTGIAAMLALRL